MAEFDYKEYARQMRENAVKDHNGNIICSSELWEQIASIIENTPAADVVEVRHGEWLDNHEKITTLGGNGVPKEYLCGYKCSLCGRIEIGKEPYCNCGAKMDGGNAE